MEPNTPTTKPLPGQPGFKTHTDRRIEIGQDLNHAHAAALAYAQSRDEAGLGQMLKDYENGFNHFAELVTRLSKKFREDAENR